MKNTSIRIAMAAIALIAMAFITPAQASSVTGAHITEIVPNNAGLVRFYIDTQRADLPACAAATPVAFTINVNTAAGQALVSAIYLAFASNLTVDVSGTGACDVETGVETLGYIGVRR